MRIASPNNRLFRAFGNWVIRRAMRTPYTHLFHDDGRPYMERFWLWRIGMPRGWQQLEKDVASMEAEARQCEMLFGREKAEGRWQKAAKWREQLYPKFAIRIHHIQSGDDRVFHDHPWNFATLILRGAYKETVPLTPEGGVRVTTWHWAGTLRLVRASQWHYLSFQENPELLFGREAWTLFITFPKRQSWGFLVDGVKVPWREYLAQRGGAKEATTP
jgi:hypothetical protein